MTSVNSNQELLACSIAEMKLDQVKREILYFDGRFKLDFTEDYLNQQSAERLRHILLAARMQQSRN
ncbi:MAG: hypothetical protein KAJ46_06330 [Sedimentisphaerales bacterium]|nr:hypothetical protein [Sedimentisphaerales bacterium]